MNWRKISIRFITLIILGFIINFGIQSWVKNSLPNFINERNDTPYNFNYSDVSYSLFNRKMIINGISIIPKTKQKGIYSIKVNKIIIHGVHFFRFITAKDLAADLIELDHPDITINQNFDFINHKNEPKKYNLGNSLQIENFVIKNGNLALFNVLNGKKIASLKNLNLHLSGVLWDIANKEKRIPISYDKAKLSVDDIFYLINDVHHLKVNKIKFENDNIETDQIFLKPNISEKQFVKGEYFQKSLIDIKIPTAKIINLDWGYDKNGFFYVKTSAVEVDSTSIKIIGKKVSQQPKNITTHIDRIIPFNLNIDSIRILNSKLNLNNHVTSNNINIVIKKIINIVNNKITVNLLKLYDNSVIIYQQKYSKYPNNQTNFTYLFDDILEIKNFSVQNSNIQYFNTEKTSILEMKNINYNLNDIIINTLITNTQKNIPFIYSTYNLEANNIYYKALKDYNFKIGKMQLANDVFYANKLKIIPKITPKQFAYQKTGENLFKINIDNINIPKINWNLENNKFNIQAPSVTIKAMDAIMYENPNVKSRSKKIHLNNSDLDVNVLVDTFKISKSTISQYNALSGNLTTSVKDLTLTINSIIFNDTSENSTLGLPFSFYKFNGSGKNIFQDLGNHILQLNNIHFTNSSLVATGIKMLPKLNKQTLMKKKGIDSYTINLAKVEIPMLDFGVPNREIQFVAPIASFYKLETTIHQYDIPDKDYVPIYKPLFSEKLRKLKFKLDLKQINLINSYLSYEEESLEKGTGKIFFTNINAQIKNINSGYKVSTLPDVIVDFNSKFMYSGKISAIWKFNVLNPADYFTVKGKIYGLPAKKIDKFVKPYLNVSAEGDLKEVSFDFAGNNNKGNGSFGMDYKDLKVTIYKKDGKKEKKLLSSLANLIVKKNSKDSLKIVKIKEVERSKDKSFFNFLWKMALSGLKETLLLF